MRIQIIGRQAEQKTLQSIYDSQRPEFLAIYGRRRVGKTFLVKQFYGNKKSRFFSVTGIQKGALLQQIQRFTIEIGRVFNNGLPLKPQKNWFDTFDLLVDAINKNVQRNEKIILFFDEFPWLVTPRSNLLNVLEYFWNQYWSHDPRIKLIICGSSASWILKKIVNNKGGLHNRITYKLRLPPFSLKESKDFLVSQSIKLNNKQIAQLYMVTGGIPYYLAAAQKGLSITQLIEQLAFQQNSILFTEFDNLLSSLFKEAASYNELLRLIAGHRYGIEQDEISKKSPYSSGGRLVDKLNGLEDAGFIEKFVPHLHKQRGIYYKVIDEYTLFYLRWIEPVRNTLQKHSLESGYWESQYNSPAWSSWAGYAFEAICYKHISQIRKKLNISPGAIASVWRYVPSAKSNESGAQIDLLFDRMDDAVTICEIKYSDSPFVIDKQYAKTLLNKINVFVSRTSTNKQILLSFVAANGVKDNVYADDIISGAVVTLDDLFSY